MTRLEQALLTLLNARNTIARRRIQLKTGQNAQNAYNLRQAYSALKKAEAQYEEEQNGY